MPCSSLWRLDFIFCIFGIISFQHFWNFEKISTHFFKNVNYFVQKQKMTFVLGISLKCFNWHVFISTRKVHSFTAFWALHKTLHKNVTIFCYGHIAFHYIIVILRYTSFCFWVAHLITFIVLMTNNDIILEGMI